MEADLRVARRLHRCVRAGVMAMTALAIAVSPGLATANDERFCGSLLAVNSQNQLLRLGNTAALLGDDDERGILSLFFGDTVRVRARQKIAGLAPGETLLGIDVRPAKGVIYALGRIGTDNVGQLYTFSGVAPAVGARTIPLDGASFGVDFNPVPDRLRIVSDTGQSIRVNPDNGLVVGTDGAIMYPAMGDPNSGRLPKVVAVAYTNPDTDMQTNTVLHDIDVARGGESDRDGDVLAIQVPPNAGTLNTVGALRVDVGDVGGFDIGPNNEAFAALQPVGSNGSRLYFIDLPSGQVTDLGSIGRNEVITGLAIGLGPDCKDDK
jgi:hypothetical protein